MVDRDRLQARIDAIDAQRQQAVELVVRCEGALQALRSVMAEDLKAGAEQAERITQQVGRNGTAAHLEAVKS